VNQQNPAGSVDPTKHRRIVFVTGTRADFGKMQPLAAAAAAVGFEIAYFVTGMHMLRQYGDTRLEVRAQVESMNADVYEFVNQSPGDSHDAVLTKTLQGFADWVTEYPADLVVIHGDRIEALAVALVCAINYLPCAHVEGGEVSGTIDEIYRHCNSKLCRYHFVSSESAARRVQALGENPSDTFVIGSPELDLHGSESEVDLDEVRRRYDIDFEEYGIVVFHSVTSERESMRQQAEQLFGSLSSSGKNFIVICPNNDPGSEDILEIINGLPSSRFRVIPSMRFSYFSTLMKHAAVIAGNSSLGVREAPFLGVPSIDIGTRQHNRASLPSITNASADDVAAIERFLHEQWGIRLPRSKAFGSGDAGARFGQIIAEESFWVRPRQKSFFDRQ
jgi:UDP-N-acetylglucosamine 2-epimerase (hydrolysing)